MSTKVMIELFGYLGSALVVVSMLMTSVMKLRVINTIGSIIFVIYALVIRSYPTALMNFFLVGINVYHMIRLTNTKKHYDLVEVSSGGGYFNYLMRYYGEDIARFFPDARRMVKQADAVYVICCDSAPAGVFAGRRRPSGMEICLDYSTPVYRDCSVGTFLYAQLKEKGIKELSCRCDVREHIVYLEKMGFVRKNEGEFVKEL